jgi:hypothetical protein
VGFKGQRPKGRAESYGSCHMVKFLYISTGIIGDIHRYPWVIEGKVTDVHRPKKEKLWMHWKTSWYKVVQHHMSF